MIRSFGNTAPLMLALLALAGTVTPISANDATPDPGVLPPGYDVACDSEPASLAGVERALASGTAVTEPDPVDLPRGEPAGTELIAAVVALEARFVTCYNAADWPRLFGLMTANATRQLFDDGDFSPRELFAATGTPIAGDDPAARLVLIGVHDVRRLPDGRALAIAWWATASDPTDVSEVNIHRYRQVDGVWLLDDEITP